MKNEESKIDISDRVRLLLIEFLREKKKTDPDNVHDTRTSMYNEFYVWLLKY